MKVCLLVILAVVFPEVDGRFIKVTPENQQKVGFAISVKRGLFGATEVVFPAWTERYAIREVQILIRKPGVKDNTVLPEIGIPVSVRDTDEKGRKVVRFTVADAFVDRAGLLFQYGIPEQEDNYSINLRNWIVKKK